MKYENAPLIRIGKREVGADNPVYIIAEACDNHLGDLYKAKEMVRRAKLAGCDAVKFQHHLPDEEMLPDIPMSNNFSEPLYEFLQRCALDIEQHSELKSHCESLGIQYLCTPFSYKAARELADIGVDALKIGSGEMTDLPSLRRMAVELRLPMVISTGMSSYEEIDETYNLLAICGIQFSLLNCISEYPPDYGDINLGVIPIMSDRYPKAVIGHSDHTPDIYTTFAAVALGASIIEKHVTLDKNQVGPDQSVSIDFIDMTLLVDGVRKVQAALGQRKEVHPKEEEIRRWAFRSLVTINSISQGEEISLKNVWSKRPGTGIPSRYLDQVIGRKVVKNLSKDHVLSWDDLELGEDS